MGLSIINLNTLFGARRVTDGPAVVNTKWVICPLLSQGARKRVAPLVEPSAPASGTTGITRVVVVEPLVGFNVNFGAMATGGLIEIAYLVFNQSSPTKKRTEKT